MNYSLNRQVIMGLIQDRHCRLHQHPHAFVSSYVRNTAHQARSSSCYYLCPMSSTKQVHLHIASSKKHMYKHNCLQPLSCLGHAQLICCTQPEQALCLTTPVSQSALSPCMPMYSACEMHSKRLRETLTITLCTSAALRKQYVACLPLTDCHCRSCPALL